MYWIYYSIGATLALGVSMSLYKMPSYKGYSSFFSTFWSNVFSAMFVILIIAIVQTNDLLGLARVSWYALVWGIFFATTMVLQKLLLKRVESNAVYPVTSSLGSVITVLLGITLLSESITPLQGLGTAIILLSVFLFTRKGGAFHVDSTTALLALGIITASTISKYVQKLGAVNDTVTHFMLWQYIGASLFALVITYFFEKEAFRKITRLGQYWKGSALIGFFSAFGGYLIFMALSTGPLSGVYAIHPSYTIIAGIFGYLLFGEQLTTKKITLALLSAIGVILIKIGQ
ncbi:MAG: DMT family transporter [Patescibacteria group bacterium]|jgi:drug/metabolite transporter (DMT)-like permease